MMKILTIALLLATVALSHSADLLSTSRKLFDTAASTVNSNNVLPERTESATDGKNLVSAISSGVSALASAAKEASSSGTSSTNLASAAIKATTDLASAAKGVASAATIPTNLASAAIKATTDLATAANLPTNLLTAANNITKGIQDITNVALNPIATIIDLLLLKFFEWLRNFIVNLIP